MNNTDQKIELYFNKGLYSYYCTFNLNDEFVLYGNVYEYGNVKKLDSYIWIYSTKNEFMNSTQTVNNECVKWMCKGIYKIPEDYKLNELISEKYDKFYLLSNNFIYEWNITDKSIRSIFVNENMVIK